MNWIVVADRSTEILQDAGHILCKRKMRVTGFRSGQALLEFLKDNQPDLILLGSVLWEIGGFEAISALKKARKMGKGIPVLLMAERGEPDLEARAGHGGCRCGGKAARGGGADGARARHPRVDPAIGH